MSIQPIMTKNERRAAQRRCDEAASSPWRVGVAVVNGDVLFRVSNGAEPGVDPADSPRKETDQAKADLIAHASVDLPKTLALLDVFESQNRQLRESLEWVARNSLDPRSRKYAQDALHHLDREEGVPSSAYFNSSDIDGEWCI